MRKIIFPLFAVVVALFAAGCTGPEQKLGRGLSNTYEIVRLGELRRSVEQNAVLYTPGTGYYGLIHGFDRSIQRTGIGLYEVVTFPIPSYKPVFTKSFDPDPVFPESYKPGLYSDALFDTDTYTGFSGGDVAPFIPGSRFQVFDN
jgi:putative exosortase-associated protein (TIGR04073 family)